MEITPELIQKFLAGECDPEEIGMVLHYFEAHPAEADRWLGLRDWAAIDKETPVTDHDQRQVYSRLRERLFSGSGANDGLGAAERSGAAEQPGATGRSGTAEQPGAANAGGSEMRPGLVRRMVWPAVAVSMLLAVTGIWLNRPRVHAPAEATLAAGTPAKASDTLGTASPDIVKTNNGGKPQKLTLPDGSEVTLYAHSRLSYASAFGVTGRESRLEGTADFSVHKNKALPFTVHSGVLSTTALGTSFGVRRSVSGKATEVRLYSGKVVVKADAVAGWAAAIYLNPGERVSYDGKGGPALVSRFELSPAHDANSNDMQDVVFNNASLKKVFKQLAIQYHVTISYRAAELKGMNFTGTVSSADSLQSLLHLLGNMNNLEIREEAGGFRIVRQQ